MKLYRQAVLPLFLLLFCSMMLCSCAAEPAATAEQNTVKAKKQPPAATKMPAVISCELPLYGKKAEAFCYNPADNSLTLIERTGSLYQASHLTPDNTWDSGAEKWHMPSSRALDNFAYDESGCLYACQKKTARGKNSRRSQKLVRLKRNGKITPCPLTGLNEAPAAARDPAGKKSRQADGNIADIQFFRTSLAVTYQNNAVKFYNIAEGMAFGGEGITGVAGANTLYDTWYLTRSLNSPDRLDLFDIRIGEKLFSATPRRTAPSSGILFLTGYRDKFYLLTGEGLFSGIITEENLFCSLAAESDSLGFSTKDRVIYFQAARDDVLYVVTRDASDILHLFRLTLPQRR